MAGKGRLQEALARAKLRREETAAVAAGDRAAAPAVAVAPATIEERQAAIHAIPRFPQVEYDPDHCEKSRILVPDESTPAKSGGAAAYRMLRTRILQRARSNRWNTIGVTSPGPGDGKSVTALNVALSIAREKNSNVFLLDLDMRNPKMCAYLGVTPPREITEYFMGEAHPRDVMFSIGVEGITFAGTLTPTLDASELLASGRIEEMFAYIRSVAPEPLILVDLPPLLSTDDAIIVAAKVDACLLVVSEGKSRRDGAAKALELLAEFQLAGIVLNRSRAAVQDYYSY
jgi:Mrp family chromosome partitioning ATPase